jgi:hypothetical protein
MLRTIRTRKACWATVPGLLVGAFALVASGGGPASAGGYPGASCPSGVRTDIVIPGTGTGGPGSPAVHVESGFYALSGFFWPPSTLITCRTQHTAGHPFVRPGGTGCHAGAVPMQIPYELPPDYSTVRNVDWGTFLPGGWYYGAGQNGTWATVCWYARQPATDGSPAALPGVTPPSAPAVPTPVVPAPAIPIPVVPAPGGTPTSPATDAVPAGSAA